MGGTLKAGEGKGGGGWVVFSWEQGALSEEGHLSRQEREHGVIWRESTPSTGSRKCRGSEAAVFWKPRGGWCD